MSISQAPSFSMFGVFWRIRPKIKKEKGWPGDKGQKIRGAGHQLEQCFSKRWQKKDA